MDCYLCTLGIPLDGAALLRSAVKLKSTPPHRQLSSRTSKYLDDVDGVPSKGLLILCGTSLHAIIGTFRFNLFRICIFS